MNELEARVREHLQPGEDFRAAVWASRADGRAAGNLTRAEMSPFRFRRPVRDDTRRDLRGAPASQAAGLDEHLRNVTEPRLLALTDRRLLVLAQGRRLFRRASGGARLSWECPRADLASAEATEQAGRLRLTFTDGSGITLLTPASGIEPFLAARHIDLDG